MLTSQQLQLLASVLNDGKAQSQRADQLANLLNMPRGRTEEPTRDMLREAIIQHNFPIGSGRNGYFLINTQQEFNDHIAGLQNRIQGLQNRINAIQTGWKLRQTSRSNSQNWPK